MKKRITAFMTMLLTAFNILGASTAVFAADVKTEYLVEAEDYTTATEGFTLKENGNYSGGEYIQIYSLANQSKFELTYKFNVEKTGVYRLTNYASLRGNVDTADWTIYINEESNTSGSYKGTRTPSTSWGTFDCGTFKLQKGENTMYVQIDKADLNKAGQVVAFFDYFKFKKEAVAFSLENVYLENSEIGVYQKGESVMLQFEFTNVAPKLTQYRFEVVDYWGRDVKDGIISIKKGDDARKVMLGNFDVGWYRIKIYDMETGEEVSKYLAFSVTQPLSKRKAYEDNALATDWAAESHAGTKERKEAYIEAMKFAGFDWFRSRGGGTTIAEDRLAVKYAADEAGLKELDVPFNFGNITFKDADLKKAYDTWQEIVKNRNDVTEVYEIFNETDLTGGDFGPAEAYASYMKAAAIGLSDLDPRPYKSVTGLAGYKSKYVKLLYQNRVLDYSDIYNFHAHAEVSARTLTSRARANAYSDGSVPIWIGEAGIHQVVPEATGYLSNAQMRTATRYSITSAMESISNGTNKHFWFLFRPYLEKGGNYGCFHTDHMPYPMYSALANMTYQLGQAHIKGEAANLPDGMNGYVFDDGNGNDVFVLWSEGEDYYYLSGDTVTYSDMMGYEETKRAENGKIKVNVTYDPVFIKFNGRCDESNYFKYNYETELGNKSFEPHQRIVLQQSWEYDNLKDARNNGYIIKRDEPKQVKVRVWNLNDTPMSGKVGIHLDENLKSEQGEFEFNLKPWESTEFVTYELVATDKAAPSDRGNVKFCGTTSDGKEISPSVANYYIPQEARVIEADKIKLYDNDAFYMPENWDGNVAEGTKVQTKNDMVNKTISFKYTFGGQQWAFPRFKIEDTSVLEDTQGFVFDRFVDEAPYDKEVTQMYIYMKDGRNYYSGKVNENAYSNEWKQCIFPFSSFSLYYSPLGAADIREFRLEDIEAISIGISGAEKNQPYYTIKNFGFFYSDLPSDQLDTAPAITFEGMEENKIYKQGEPLTLNAKINRETIKNIENIRVMIGNDEYEKFTVNNDVVQVDLSGLDRGRYNVFVFVEDDMEYINQVMFKFYVE